MLQFAVVEFIESKTAGVICCSWFKNADEDICLYPHILNRKGVNKMLSENAPPTSSWKSYPVKVLCKSGNLDTAYLKMERALESSNLETETEDTCTNANGRTARKRTIPQKYLEESEPKRFREDNGDSTDSDLHEGTPLSESDGEEPPPTAPWIDVSKRSHVISSPAQFSQRPLNSTQHNSRSLSTIDESDHSERTVESEGEIFTLMRRMFRRIEDLAETLKVHGSMLQSLIKNGKVVTHINLPEGATFPLSSIEEFNSMETKLKDPAFAAGMNCYLGDIGGRNLDETIRRVMKLVLKTELALQFNLSGVNGKRGFGGSALFEAVNNAVKLNTFTSSHNKKEVERSLSKWFSGCRDRDGNRARRASKENRSATQSSSGETVLN